MKGKLLKGMVLATTVSLLGSAYAFAGMHDKMTANTKMISFEGYITDVLCGLKGKDPNGLDIMKNPEKHRLMCLKDMKECQQSGYGVLIKGKNGSYKFYKFDKQGTALALKEYVNKTKKMDNLLVKIQAEIGKEKDTIVLHTITEK